MVLSEHCKGLSEVIDVVGHAHTFDHHVINVGLHVSSDLMSEDLIDHPLVGGSGILQPEGHYLVMVSPPISDEGCLFFIFGCHVNLVVAAKSVHEGKHLASDYIIEQDVGDWQGKCILRACFVEISEVHTDP